jgi:hypothetical protein
MDVSHASTSAEPRGAGFGDRELPLSAYCHSCGYPRIGLPDGARCPECGDAPLSAVNPVLGAQGMAQNRVDQAWLASVAGGLALLVFSSIVALKVGLLMSLGGLVLTAVNAPAPKLWAATLLQRSIGSPGEWGVLGTVAVMGNVLAVWLVTEPRFSGVRSTRDFDDVIRRLARWSCVGGCGALAGLLWGGYGIDRWWSWDGLNLLVIAVGVVELPANGLLYWHLSRLARRFDAREDAPLTRTLALGAMLVPAVCGAGVMMSILRGAMQDKPVVPWRYAQSAYGAFAFCCGMLMTGGALTLLARVLVATTDQSVASLAGKLARLRGTLGRFVSNVRNDPARWACALGLMLWLWNTSPMLRSTALIEHRRGVGGDLPAFNFVGPKVGAVVLLSGGEYYRDRTVDGRAGLIATVLAIWLITAMRKTPRASSEVARWVPTVLAGLALGLTITTQQAGYDVRQSYWAAALMLLVEAPATFVVYRYLAYVADACETERAVTLAKQLRRVSLAATAIILSPFAFYVLSVPLRRQHDHPLLVIAGAAYGAIAVAVAVVAWAVIAKMIWMLATLSSTTAVCAPAPATGKLPTP